MRALVTGANGQLGLEVARVWGAAGDELMLCAHSDLDVADREATLQAIGASQPDVVLHLGAWTNVDGCETDPARAYASNAIGSRNVAEASALIGARVVYVSTDYVFDGRGNGSGPAGGYTEWDATGPVSHYGRSKLGGEQETRSILGPAATVVRTSWVCGEFGNNFVKTMLRLALDPAAKPVTVVDDQRGCPTFTADLAVTLRQLAVGRYPGVFHASNEGALTWCGFARAIFEAAGANSDRVTPISSDQLVPVRPAPRPAFSVLDNAALRGVGLAALPPWQPALEQCVRAALMT